MRDLRELRRSPVRRGSFTPRTVVELRADEPPRTGMDVSVVSNGKPFAGSAARIDDLARVGPITVDLPADRPPELYVWAHRPTRDGDTQPLPVETDGDVGADQVVIRAPRGWLPT